MLDDGGNLPLPATTALESVLGERIALGFRPEHLQPVGEGEAGFDVRVEGVEPVGNEVFLNLALGTQPLVARVAPHAMPRAGEQLRMAIDGAHLHLFDADSGRRL